MKKLQIVATFLLKIDSLSLAWKDSRWSVWCSWNPERNSETACNGWEDRVWSFLLKIPPPPLICLWSELVLLNMVNTALTILQHGPYRNSQGQKHSRHSLTQCSSKGWFLRILWEALPACFLRREGCTALWSRWASPQQLPLCSERLALLTGVHQTSL